MDNNNLTRARVCSFRKDNLCGKAKSCELCSYMRNIKKLWIKFCDTPIQYSRTGCTTEEFNNFPIGTFRANIVDWFCKTFEVDIDALKEMTGRYLNTDSEDSKQKSIYEMYAEWVTVEEMEGIGKLFKRADKIRK